MKDDFVTQDIIKCDRCGKNLPGYELNIMIVYPGKLTAEWKDARVVNVCNKCRQVILNHKKQSNEFTEYAFKNLIGVPKQVRKDENGKAVWRNKK